MSSLLPDDWTKALHSEFCQPYYKQLQAFLEEEYPTHSIYPERPDIFNAFYYTPLHKVKVVILGQDPYHGFGQAHGLSFSVPPGVSIPPSLRNILKELQDDLGCTPPGHGNLQHWAEQGVLLLNTVLTVQAGKAQSHRGKGWETFTDEVIRVINARMHPAVFLLWGSPAQKKGQMIDTDKHHVISSPHPSPLSAYRGFFGSKPFSKTNLFLQEQHLGAIDWQLPMDY